MSVQGICVGSFVGMASVIGLSAAGSLSTYWAGLVVAFPKDAQYKLTLKGLEICDQIDGRNQYGLACWSGMTSRGMGELLQRILEKVKT
ncbi:Mor transcription activator family protein [Acidovorax sp. FJL06]|uniref:Mor transcription activator family protein n=1 Tax=Acidovorax sp. FJL06 TaxID=2153365 RepID=UPI000F586FCB|nr:Mor transcription activator family protein [Acidovorax sp. FJL06]RQO80362.1 hypothetical protein DBV10_20050 [Acidovorax sp. FJL06]